MPILGWPEECEQLSTAPGTLAGIEEKENRALQQSILGRRPGLRPGREGPGQGGETGKELSAGLLLRPERAVRASAGSHPSAIPRCSQMAAVRHKSIRNRTSPRKTREKLLLRQGRNRILQIGGPHLQPEGSKDFRHLRRQARKKAGRSRSGLPSPPGSAPVHASPPSDAGARAYRAGRGLVHHALQIGDLLPNRIHTHRPSGA